MKKILLAFLFLSCINKKSTNNLPFVYIDPKVPHVIHAPIKNALENYYIKYGAPDSVSVYCSKNGICYDSKIENGIIMSPLAYSKSKNIYFCSDVIKYFDQETAFFVTTHELFHTLARDTTFIEPFTILNRKYKVLGYLGLAVLVEKPDRTKTFIRSVEEAAAEVSARLIVPNYKATSTLYTKIGNKLGELGKYKFKFLDLVNFQRTNDFPSFCGKLLGKNRNEIMKEDIEETLLLFGF